MKNKLNTMTKNSLLVNVTIDFTNIPEFARPPVCTSWLWADNTADLVKNIFDYEVSEFVLCDISKIVEDEMFVTGDFNYAIEQWKPYMNTLDDKGHGLNKLYELYKTYTAKEINYLDLVELLIDIERICTNYNWCIQFRLYPTPLEARHDVEQPFNFDDLESNFVDGIY